MTNKVILGGNVGNPESIKYGHTPSGLPVLEFSLAVALGIGKSEKTSWVNAVVFGDLAETLHTHENSPIRKGGRVTVFGILRQEKWTKKDQSTGYKTVVTVSDVLWGQARSNVIVAQGILGRDATFGQRADGKKFAIVSMADKTYAGKGKEAHTTWFSLFLGDASAKFYENNGQLTKGSFVTVDGGFYTGDSEKNGVTYVTPSISVKSISVSSNGKNDAREEAAASAGVSVPPADFEEEDECPFHY